MAHCRCGHLPEMHGTNRCTGDACFEVCRCRQFDACEPPPCPHKYDPDPFGYWGESFTEMFTRRVHQLEGAHIPEECEDAWISFNNALGNREFTPRVRERLFAGGPTDAIRALEEQNS